MSQTPVIRVVDDDPAVLKSLRFLLESMGWLVDTYESARDFLDHHNLEQPGCVVLDVRMKEMNGLDLQDEMRRRGIVVPVIIMTAYGNVPMAVRALQAGAIHFIEKPVHDQPLLDHVQRAIQLDREQREIRGRKTDIVARAQELTAREREVMKHIVDGLPNKEIALKLKVSVKTVEAHRAKVMKKMKAGNVTQLVHMSLSLNLDA